MVRGDLKEVEIHEGSVTEYFADIDVMIAGDSAIHMEAVGAGVPSGRTIRRPPVTGSGHPAGPDRCPLSEKGDTTVLDAPRSTRYRA